MQILYDGLQCLDASAVEQALADLSYPAPGGFERANCFANVLGQQPARGWFLMTRATIGNVNSTHTITMGDDLGNMVTLYGLIHSREPVCVTPGAPGDPMAVFLVELSDNRHKLASPFIGTVVNKQYNVTAPAYGGQNYEDTEDSGSPWTWQGMVQDLWDQCEILGSAPDLPSGTLTDGTPSGWKFPGVSAWVALNQVLHRLGCSVSYDPTEPNIDDQYDLVLVGDEDEDAEDILSYADNQNRRIHDEEAIPIVQGLVAGKVQVCFHTVYSDYGSEQTTRQNGDQWSTDAVQTETVSGMAPAGADASMVKVIWDDLEAEAEANGTISNTSDLVARANNRAADYYRMVYDGGQRFYRTYSGIVDLQPGSQYKGVAWRQDPHSLGDPDGDGGGFITEVVNYAWWQLAVSTNTAGPLWEESSTSADAQAPDFAPTYPNYPHLMQVVRLTGSTTTSGGNTYYDAFVQQYDPVAGTWSDEEEVWVRDANN